MCQHYSKRWGYILNKYRQQHMALSRLQFFYACVCKCVGKNKQHAMSLKRSKRYSVLTILRAMEEGKKQTHVTRIESSGRGKTEDRASMQGFAGGECYLCRRRSMGAGQLSEGGEPWTWTVSVASSSSAVA